MEEKKKSGCLSVFLLFGLVCFGVALIAYFSVLREPAAKKDTDYDVINDITLTTVQDTTNQNTSDNETTTEKEQPNQPKELNAFYYNQLTDSEKEIYKSIQSAAGQGLTNVKVPRVDGDKDAIKDLLRRVISAFERDNPQYFWLREGFQFTQNSTTLSFDITCFDFWSTITPQKYLTAMQEKIQQIAVEAQKLPSDYEKALYVHDYLVTHAEYDYDGLEETEKTNHDAKYDYIFTPYGCLVNGKTVCAGYAKAYQIIMETLGIECVYIVGDTVGNDTDILHAWNLLKLDGEYYYVDVTWDDNGTEEYPNEASHTYFCLTTKDLEITHIVDTETFNIPVCTAEKYNYFAYNDIILTSSSRDSLVSILNKAPGEKMLEFKYTDAAASLIEKINQASTLQGVARLEAKNYSYMYATDKDNRVAVIILE